MLVVWPADFLNKLTVRKVIALIPVAILLVAFAQHIPLPAEIVFFGDALAYLDILTIVFVLAAIARAGAILYFVRQMGESIAHRLAKAIMPMVRRADSRHRRAVGALRRHLKKQDDEQGPISWGVPA